MPAFEVALKRLALGAFDGGVEFGRAVAVGLKDLGKSGDAEALEVASPFKEGLLDRRVDGVRRGRKDLDPSRIFRRLCFSRIQDPKMIFEYRLL